MLIVASRIHARPEEIRGRASQKWKREANGVRARTHPHAPGLQAISPTDLFICFHCIPERIHTIISGIFFLGPRPAFV